jgi:hypothetical protein
MSSVCDNAALSRFELDAEGAPALAITASPTA